MSSPVFGWGALQAHPILSSYSRRMVTYLLLRKWNYRFVQLLTKKAKLTNLLLTVAYRLPLPKSRP